MTTVGVAIPTIPPRDWMLQRAVESVKAQHRPPEVISIACDTERAGAAVNRNNAWRPLDTDWIAFLDDDDEFHPHHLRFLLDAQEASGADLVWPWFSVVGGTDPFPEHRGRQWDPADPHQIPITVLIRRELLEDVGGFVNQLDGPTDPAGNRIGEDYDLWLRASAAGAKFFHIPDISWTWHHHRTFNGGNTSGLPDRW